MNEWTEDEEYLMSQTVTEKSEPQAGLFGPPDILFGPGMPFPGRRPEPKTGIALIQASQHRNLSVTEREPLLKIATKTKLTMTSSSPGAQLASNDSTGEVFFDPITGWMESLKNSGTSTL